MQKPERMGWAVILGGLIAFLAVVAAGAWGCWRYISEVPPFHPELPPRVEPNGRAKADQALLRLFAATDRPPVPATWPDGTPAQLRTQLMALRPILNQVRAAFSLEWQARPVLSVSDPDPATSGIYSGFRKCTQGFVAESILARDEGDYDTGMSAALDAMELGSRILRGDSLFGRLIGIACHALGFSQAAKIVSHLSASAIPGALRRVRRLRRNWPPLSETLESERITHLAMDTEAFRQIAHEPLYRQLEPFRSDGASLWDTAQLFLTPRRTILANTNRFFLQAIAESKLPFRRRHSVPPPGDAWSRATVMELTPAVLVRQEREGTDLALLEVALTPTSRGDLVFGQLGRHLRRP